MNKLHTFKIFGHDATLLDGKIEVSVPNEDDGSKIIIRFASAILDKKFKSLRINLPNKIIYMSAKDSKNILLRAEEANNKRTMN